MKAHVKLQAGRLVVEVEGKTVKEIFTEIAAVQEVFDGDPQCGACGAPWPICRVREREGFLFFEMVCVAENCGAELKFGATREGGELWPKRRDDETGEFLPNRGWRKYVKPAGGRK